MKESGVASRDVQVLCSVANEYLGGMGLDGRREQGEGKEEIRQGGWG